MKKLMLLSLLLLTTIFVNAQRGQRGGGNPEARVEKQVERLTTELDLSTEQQTQLKAIFIEQHQNRKAGGKKMQDLSQAEKEAMKAERKAAKAATDAKIAAVLTPTQLATFQNMAKERKGRRGAKGEAKGKRRGNKEKVTPEVRAQKRTDKLTEQLGLDANQQTAIYNLFLNQPSKPKKGNRKELSAEEKEVLKADRKENKAAFNAALAQILTPAQLETFQNLSKEKKGKKKGKGKKKNKKKNKNKQ